VSVRSTAAALIAAAALTLAVALGACSSGGAGEAASPLPSGSPSQAPPAGTRLAPGLYDLADGTVQAVGTAEYRDLEGGFWAVVGGTEATGDVGTVVAVLANGDEFAGQLEQLRGLPVIVEGTRLEGASIRMAGPEIEATRVVATGDAAGPAD